MIIRDLKMLNIDTLYNFMYLYNSSGADDIDYFATLSNVEIEFILDDVTTFEFISLKNMCDDIFELNDNRNHNLLDASNIQNKIKPLIDLMLHIYDNTGITLSSYIFPSSLVASSYLCRLSGVSLANLIGPSLKNFFVNASNKGCMTRKTEDDSEFILDKDYGKPEVIYNDDDLRNFIITNFAKLVYKNIDKSLKTNLSVLCRDIMHSVADLGDIAVLTVRNPLINIQDDSPEVIEAIVNEYKTNVQGKMSHLDTSIQFVLNVPFIVYIEMLKFLPNRIFKFTQPLQIGMNQERIDEIYDVPEECDPYKNRLYASVKSVYDEIIESYTASSGPLKYYSYTPNYIKFSFCIELSLRDIDNYILPMIDKLEEKKSSYYEDKKLLEILNGIVTVSQDIFRLVNI